MSKSDSDTTNNQAEIHQCLYWKNATGEQWFNWPMIEIAACDPTDVNHDMARAFAAARAAGMRDQTP